MNKSKYNVFNINGKELRYSHEIECKEKGNGDINIYIKNTSANMQEDSSNFESIIISIWSVDRTRIITLRYKPYLGENDKGDNHRNEKWSGLKQYHYIGENGVEYAEAARLHYMRFLYRVMKFRERYGRSGFNIDSSNVDEVNKFEKLYKDSLKNGDLWITKPTTEGGLKGYDEKTNKINYDDEIAENHLEKWFMLRSWKNELPKQLVDVFGNNRLYDQLPCCMFIGEPRSSTRIFNAGYFDLWGINDKDELCVFELKKSGNDKLGIISELFFYAMLMKDMKQAVKDKYARIQLNHRGFKDFKENKNENIVNAYFLVPELHSFLEKPGVKDNFLNILNEANDGIKFGLIYFDQDKDIVKDNKELFYKNLISDWKNYPVK